MEASRRSKFYFYLAVANNRDLISDDSREARCAPRQVCALTFKLKSGWNSPRIASHSSSEVFRSTFSDVLTW